MTTNQDQIYITKVIKGDANAFTYVIDTYKNMVFALALQVTKNREEAEEVTQDTFVKAYQNLATFNWDSKFSTWLYKIAYRTALDSIKKNKKHQQTYELTEVSLHHIKDIEQQLDAIDIKKRSKMIDACLHQLPEDEKSIIWMFYYDELTLKEILEVTNLTESTLKVKLHRARKKLLEIVKNNVEPALIEHYGRK